ncbi:hypothetical protein AMECASPLE_008177 [Ameca splendens]|uniref:Uncharacterized protein n=1 Tax=Ameca splendens TaxID=208324 RepID=A0ABV0YB04_9TELE
MTLKTTSGHSSHVFHTPPAWHLSIISLVGMPHSCHHHHGNASVLPVAITMAMGVSPSNYPHGPKCKPLNQDHHGNACLLKHQAVVNLLAKSNNPMDNIMCRR